MAVDWQTNQERFDVLLAMGIAFSERQREESSERAVEENKKEAVSAEILKVYEALEKKSLSSMRERINYYESLSEDEKQLWRTRILNRVRLNGARLDKEVHHSQIAEVLKTEPAYIRQFILRHLPTTMVATINSAFGPDTTEDKLDGQDVDKEVHPDLEKIVRRNFLSKFVAQEDLNEIKPLALLSSKNLSLLLQQLGRDELALVCRGIKEIENLASFLRLFDPADAQAIVERMATLRSIEKKRLDQAEILVNEIWQSEINPTLVVKLVGIYKLAAAFSCNNDQRVRYTTQKLSIDLSSILEKRLDFICQKIEKGDLQQKQLSEIYASEVETTAARLLLDQMQMTNVS